MTLADQIQAWLSLHGEGTAEQIARGVRCRNVEVLTCLRSDARFPLAAPRGRSPRAKLYTLSTSGLTREGSGRVPTHDEKVLRLLADGKPHAHRELYDLHVVAHSRVASLRRKGHDIACWREGREYLYQLVGRAA